MVNEGIVILDDDPGHTLLDRVLIAARDHTKKFSLTANVVYVHPPVTGAAAAMVVGGISVVARKWALLHHYYAVREEV